MRLSDWIIRYGKPVLIIALLMALLGVVAGCEDFSQYPTSPPAEQPEKTPPPAGVSSGDKAILVVYEHLLTQAGSHEAKSYLADFYTLCDNWTAETERFKDGSSVWYVVVDMSEKEPWEWEPYWQQAGWVVFRDGKVIPSQRFDANALRIEADLQKLGVSPES